MVQRTSAHLQHIDVVVVGETRQRDEEALRWKIDEVERATPSLKEAQDRLVRSERLASVGRLAVFAVLFWLMMPDGWWAYRPSPR